MKYRKLNSEEKEVIENRGTEKSFSGEYWNHYKNGTYECKRCGSLLYNSADKFNSGCGWPSFDVEIPDAVKLVEEADGEKSEIICDNCNAHLGHIFTGEQFTDKNTRHCINSISLVFNPAASTTAIAYIAGGCFWGIEHYMKQLVGVISAESGYMGGKIDNPDYYSVSSGKTGHAESVKVIFNPYEISYENILRRFFEIHNPTQLNRQGPDYGTQYRSAIFYTEDKQKEVADMLINILTEKGHNIVTEIVSAEKFWIAEKYHQNYYERKGGRPYCHRPSRIFD